MGEKSPRPKSWKRERPSTSRFSLRKARQSRSTRAPVFTWDARDRDLLGNTPKGFGVHLGSLPRCIAQPATNLCVHVSGKLPETTGWQPVLPRHCKFRFSKFVAIRVICGRV